MAELRRYNGALSRVLTSLLLYGWQCKASGAPAPGDYVLLQCAPPSDWDFSIYRENQGNDFHMLESMKTGQLCRWSNVGFHVLDKEKVGFTRETEWADEQFAFRDKFVKVCKRAGYYREVPFIDEFNGETVIIGFRTRFHMDDVVERVTVEGWRKVTLKRLRAAMDGCRDAHRAASEAKQTIGGDASGGDQ